MITDPIKDGLARGWKVTDGGTLPADRDTTLEADVVIVGTGAGGGVTAELLALRGLKVLLLEEGGLHSSSDFRMRESEAYPTLYQESASRKTKDKGISILQGKTVGGTTVVNWTASFRTPPATLAHWQSHFGLDDLTVDGMASWFELMERRLNIAPWALPPNRHNQLLADGLTKLGIPAQVIPRNVKLCWNLGYCGMGCPTNAKQSMLVTTIPTALDHGASLVYRARAERLTFAQGAVREVVCSTLDGTGAVHGRDRLRVRARHVVLSGGAMNTPALLLRSGAPDPHGLIGTRTFLHPTIVSAATFAEPVDGHQGAPQSIYSDHFLQDDPATGPIGFKLEVPPVHPVIFATTLTGFGEEHHRRMGQFRHIHAALALLRDGFHPESVGGTVQLREDGPPLLDYPLSPYGVEGARRSGARPVRPTTGGPGLRGTPAARPRWPAESSRVGSHRVDSSRG